MSKKHPELSLKSLLKNRDAAGELFKDYLNALPEAPDTEALLPLNTWVQELKNSIQLDLTFDETVDEIELAELKKSEYRILYLDFLFMLYFIENQETLQEPEHIEKFKEKLVRLQIFLNTLVSKH